MAEFPIAQKQPTQKTIHGTVLHDDYKWLEDKENPEVIAYLEAENAYAQSWFASTKKLEEKINKEIWRYINEDYEEVPSKYGSYFYGSRTRKGLQYPILYRFKEGTQKEEIYMDLNEKAKGEKFFALGRSTVSHNEKLLAFSTDTIGFRQYKLYVQDLETGKVQGPIAEKVGSVVWAADNKSIFYTVEDEAKRHYRVYRHVLGQNSQQDALVYEEADERFRVYIGESRDRSLIYFVSGSHTTTEYRYISSQTPEAVLKLIFPRKQNQEYSVDVHGDQFLVRINDKGNNFRLISTPTKKPDLKTAKELVSHRKDISLDDFDVFASYYVLSERAGGLERLRVVSFADGKSYNVEFEEPSYSLFASSNNVFETTKFRYQYSSGLSPQGTYELDMATGKSVLLKERTPPGPYDKTLYKAERIFIKAKDGVEVPVSLLYRKDLFQKGQNPMHVYAYGSYGYPMNAGFAASRIPLMDRGFVMAIAHIRGGGEFGKPWHDAGKMENKMNTFTDFVDVTEGLLDRGYGARNKVFAEGGSAGGLLMGVVTNLRPDLWRGVISHVPFVDMMNTMLNDKLPLTIGEYEEWGNPNEAKAFKRMLSYSPYENMKAVSYPSLFMRTALHDSQVMYWEPAKYIAKLRTLKTDNNAQLFLTNMHAGHGGSSGRYDAIRERAQDLVFMLKVLEIEN